MACLNCFVVVIVAVAVDEVVLHVIYARKAVIESPELRKRKQDTEIFGSSKYCLFCVFYV